MSCHLQSFLMDSIILVYTALIGFKPADEERGKRKLDKFHKHVKPDLQKIVDNKKAYGIRVADSNTGKGLFNGDTIIPIHTPVAFFICPISKIKYWKDHGDGDRRNTFHYDWLGSPCVYDAKHTMATHGYAHQLGWCNHKCPNPNGDGPNCYWIWEFEPKSNVRYLVLRTNSDVPAGVQLTVDYNDGQNEGYFVSMDSLADVPPGDIVQCGCAGPGRECPLRRGYDRLVMEESIERPSAGPARKRRRRY